MMGENALALAATKLMSIPSPSDVRETLKPGAVQWDTASEFKSRRFGRYQILRPLGEGAMGNVYLALDATLDRQLALKVPKAEGTSNSEFMARFTREAKAAAGLKHANICRCLWRGGIGWYSLHHDGLHRRSTVVTLHRDRKITIGRPHSAHDLNHC